MESPRHPFVLEDVDVIEDAARDRAILMSRLDTYGYAAVRALSPDDAAASVTAVWDWLEGLRTGIRRDDPHTWGIAHWPDNIHGIIKSYGVGQAPFMWGLRTQPSVMGAFATIWKCRPSDLIVSYDGACVHPRGVAGVGELWAHRDQSPALQGRLCVQGALSLVDNRGAGAGGLVVWPGSHRIDWRELDPAAAEQKATDHWYRPPLRPLSEAYRPPMRPFTEGNRPPMRPLGEATEDDPRLAPELGHLLRAPAGTLFLWDSKTIHMGCPPIGPDAPPRIAAYICMVPRRLATEATLRKRIRYFHDKRTTSHWPHKIAVNPDAIRYRSAFVVDPRPIVEAKREEETVELTPVIRGLVGGL